MLLIHWILSVVAIFVAAYLLPGVTIATPVAGVIVAIVLGVINVFVKPVLKLLTLPITVITLGLFSLVLNALLIMLVDWMVDGFSVAGFWWAVLFSIVVSVLQAFLHLLVKEH